MTLLSDLFEPVLGRPLGALEATCLARALRAHLTARPEPESLVDALLASLDADLSRQLDAILHHPSFQALESAWRGLWLVVSRVDPRENIRCEVLSCSRDDLLLDFEDAPEIPKSSLYKIVYSGEYGPFGGRPFAAIVANYALGPGDIPLLAACAAVAEQASLVFLAGADASLVGPLAPRAAAAWDHFRRSPESRFTGLVSLRTLGRAPYAPASGPGFRHREVVARPSDHLWENGTFALAVAVARSFAISRLACNVAGPVDGVIEDLPVWSGPEGSWPVAASVEARLPDERRAELAARGFIPLGVEPETGAALFDEVPTCLAPGEGPADLAPPDLALHRDLPAVLLASRFVHALKVVHREAIGSWKDRETLLREARAQLGVWTHRPGATPDEGGAYHLRTRRPLRRAELRIDDGTSSPGWYLFEMRLEPNWSLDGRFFTLAVDGKLDKE